MKEYGKWEHLDGPRYRRQVKSKPFGFLRESWQEWTMPRWMELLAYRDRFLRHLNNEPEPEVKLDDRYTYSQYGIQNWVQYGIQNWVQGSYRFSTEALKAELERRAKEPKVSAITSAWATLSFDTPSLKKRRKRK